MSITLNVYGKRLLKREELASGMAELPEPWELRFIRDWDTLAFDKGGPMGSQMISGWHRDSGRAKEARQAFDKKDRGKLRQLFEANVYGSVHLYLTDAAAEDWPAQSDPEFLESVPKEHRAAVKASTHWYSLETYASRNDRGFELQEQMWVLLGILTDGVLEDPQEGEWEAAAGEEED